jgi:hypothetical protein
MSSRVEAFEEFYDFKYTLVDGEFQYDLGRTLPAILRKVFTILNDTSRVRRLAGTTIEMNSELKQAIARCGITDASRVPILVNPSMKNCVTDITSCLNGIGKCRLLIAIDRLSKLSQKFDLGYECFPSGVIHSNFQSELSASDLQSDVNNNKIHNRIYRFGSPPSKNTSTTLPGTQKKTSIVPIVSKMIVTFTLPAMSTHLVSSALIPNSINTLWTTSIQLLDYFDLKSAFIWWLLMRRARFKLLHDIM